IGGARRHERQGAARYFGIRIADVWNPAARHVRDLSVVGDEGIRNIHVTQVAGAHRIFRNINLARRKRHPAMRPAILRPVSAAAVPIRPRHEPRRKYRAPVTRAWNPTPTVAQIGPTTVMERRESPGVIVDPRPAPGADPVPAAEAVRRPAVAH